MGPGATAPRCPSMDGRSIVSRKPREFRRGFHERDGDSTAFPRRESREAIFVERARERVWGRVAVAAALRMSRFRKLVVTPDAERAKRLVFDQVSRPSLEDSPTVDLVVAAKSSPRLWRDVDWRIWHSASRSRWLPPRLPRRDPGVRRIPPPRRSRPELRRSRPSRPPRWRSRTR